MEALSYPDVDWDYLAEIGLLVHTPTTAQLTQSLFEESLSTTTHASFMPPFTSSVDTPPADERIIEKEAKRTADMDMAQFFASEGYMAPPPKPNFKVRDTRIERTMMLDRAILRRQELQAKREQLTKLSKRESPRFTPYETVPQTVTDRGDGKRPIKSRERINA